MHLIKRYSPSPLALVRAIMAQTSRDTVSILVDVERADVIVMREKNKKEMRLRVNLLEIYLLCVSLLLWPSCASC